MNRTIMNREARIKIAQIAEKNGLDRCELMFPGCMKMFGLAPAHRFPRRHYKSVEELADTTQWLVACQFCHEILDNRSKTTEKEKEKIFEDKVYFSSTNYNYNL